MNTARRADLLTLADQAVFSLSSAAVMLVVTLRAHAAALGAFSLLQGYCICLLQLAQAAFAEPLLVQHPASLATGRATLARAAGGSLAFGLAGAAALPLFATTALDISWAVTALAAAALPALVVCDTIRLGLTAAGHPGRALTIDLFWGSVQCTCLTFVLSFTGSLVWMTAAWSASALAAALLATAITRIRPRPTPLAWWRSHGNLARPYLAEATALAGSTYLALYLVGSLGGLESAAALRGAQALLGPSAVAANAIRVAAISACARTRLAVTALRQRSLLAAVVLGGLTLLYGLAVLLFSRNGNMRLLGPSGPVILTVLPAMIVYRACSTAAIGPFAALRALHHQRALMRLRLLSALLLPLGACIGVLYDAAAGAATGMATAAALSLLGHAMLLTTAPDRRPPPAICSTAARTPETR
ncbi:hypothetical protein GO001_12850 [Streptomyces sp. NRRL B-1677]|uniref:hypothetical protein n=1 Tax=Streptomyces sp. NRRL B-1677 TaxID=2682966 RepID=UPI001892A3AE|nr:hypothetical protein [Streptomyces sp. NRRL B-1677]MBF6046108.1 hypothetical protein [Streptomyces sp. NRRL B-1677]